MSKKYAVVKFLSSKDESYSKGYTYLNTIKAKKYDAVIVPTRYGLSLAVVTKLTDDADTTDHYGYTRCSDRKEIAEVIKSEAIANVMLVEKKKDIKKQLEKEVKKMDEVQRFKMYAENNPAFAELLAEYENL